MTYVLLERYVDEMGILEIIFIAVGVAMDAFAASISKGLVTESDVFKKGVKLSLCFGLFQMIMPFYGFLIGNKFGYRITKIDHWVAFVLLLIIGLQMIKEDEDNVNNKFDIKTLLILGIATSIDALAVGITFSILKAPIKLAVILIGLITFVISFIGFWIGNTVGNRYRKLSQVMGGLILIGIAIKTLIEHLSML